jgi:hypothetical protein
MGFSDDVCWYIHDGICVLFSMNGRLAALAEQAGYFIKFERTGSDVTLVHTKEPGTDGDLALFGELVVQDILQIINDGVGDDIDYVRYLIKRDYGVKE